MSVADNSSQGGSVVAIPEDDIETASSDAQSEISVHPARNRNWRRRLRKFAVATALTAAVGLIAGWVVLRRVEQRGILISRTGIELRQFLKEYVHAMKASDLSSLMTCYADDYQNPDGGGWSEELQTERDDILVYVWKRVVSQPCRKPEIRLQLSEHLSRIGKID